MAFEGAGWPRGGYQFPTSGIPVGISGGVGLASLGVGAPEVMEGFCSALTLALPSGLVVPGAVVVAVGVSDGGLLELLGAGGPAGVRGPGGEITCPMVVPSLPATVSPLAHSKPVTTIMASTKEPTAPTTTAPQRSVANSWERSRGRRAKERTLSRLRSREARYRAVAVVVIALAPAAPRRVPAAPSLEPSTAAVTEARAAAAIWVRLRSILRVAWSGPVLERGAVMISGMSAGLGISSGQRLGTAF